MPSLFGTNPFLILVFIAINIIGTILILRQLAAMATKPYKSNRLAIAIKSLCVLLSLCVLASTTNLLSDSVTYVHYAKHPVNFNYIVDKKDDTLYFKRNINNPYFIKSYKETIQSEDYDNYYLSSHLVIPKKAIRKETTSSPQNNNTKSTLATNKVSTQPLTLILSTNLNKCANIASLLSMVLISHLSSIQNSIPGNSLSFVKD